MSHFNKEKTLVLIKPDGVKKGLTGEIISRIEKTGLEIIALEMVKATRKKIDRHYPKDIKWIKRLGEKIITNYKKFNIPLEKEWKEKTSFEIGKLIRSWILDYMTSGSIVKILIEGKHAIEIIRKLVGVTIPLEASPGTIRGDFSSDSPIVANKEKRAVHNIIHASENKKEALHEIKLWFP